MDTNYNVVVTGGGAGQGEEGKGRWDISVPEGD